jgi:hypothetical protein
MMSRAVREAIEDVKRALAGQKPKRPDKALLGRWALPSGLVFRAKRIDPLTRLVHCTVDVRCWHVEAEMLHALLDAGELSWRGR